MSQDVEGTLAEPHTTQITCPRGERQVGLNPHTLKKIRVQSWAFPLFFLGGGGECSVLVPNGNDRLGEAVKLEGLF